MAKEASKSTVTPIKNASKHQKEKGAKEVELKERRLKAFDTSFNGREQVVYLDLDSGEIIIDGKAYDIELEFDDGYYLAELENNHKYKILYQAGNIFLEGRKIEFNFHPAIPILERKKAAKAGQIVINAPLPGNVTEISVKVGDHVKSGQTVCTLEAMKMQNDIITDAAGVVKEVYVKQGELVSSNQRLILIVNEDENSD